MDIYSSIYHYSYGYPTENKWIDNETVILARSQSPYISKKLDSKSENELVSVNTDDGSVSQLCRGVTEWLDYLVLGKDVYFVKEKSLFKVNVDTKEEKRLVFLAKVNKM